MINITKIAKNNIRHNKSKSLLIILTIFLATTLLASVSMVGLDWNEVNKKKSVEYYGSYHGAFTRVNEHTYEKINSHADIESTGIINGIGSMEEFEDETNIGLFLINENAFKLSSGVLSEGKLPTKENEIAIDDLALEKLGYDKKINQTINIEYYDSGADEVIIKDFVVTGITNPSETAQIKKSYTIIVSENYMATTRDMSKETFNTFFTLKGGEDMYSHDVEMVVDEIAKSFDIKKVNSMVNENYINSVKPDMTVVGGIVVICIVIILSSILVIYNIFYLSIITKVQEFGKLRAIGTTKKQIKKIILKEGMYLSIIAIPLGLMAGFIISELITKYLLGEEVSVSKIFVAVVIGIISIITVYISLIKPMKVASRVSIVEAVKYNGEENPKKKTRKGYDYINVERLTKANLESNKKRTYVTILSLTLSGIIFVVASCGLSSMNPEKMARTHFYNDIRIDLANYTLGENDSPETELNMLQKQDLLGEEFINQMKEVDGVEAIEVSGRMIKAKSINQELENEYTDISSISEDDVEYMETYLMDGVIDLEKLKAEEGIILNLSAYADMFGIKVGDTIEFELYDGEEVTTKEFKIQAITDGPGIFVVHEDVMKELTKTNSTTSIGINVDKGSYDDVKAYVKSLEDSNPNLDASYIDLEIESSAASVRLMSVMIYSLVIIIGVIGFINLVNSMITSIITRKKELGMLQAIGLTNKQLTKMLNKEAMFYTSTMLIGSLTIGNVLGYIAVQLMKKSGASYASYSFPMMQMIIMVVCVVLAQLVLTYLISKNFNKESLIDRVRYND